MLILKHDVTVSRMPKIMILRTFRVQRFPMTSRRPPPYSFSFQIRLKKALLQNQQTKMAALSEDDFVRVQTQLIELKTSNYNLDELCRRKNNEIATLSTKLESIENEYQKAMRTISKSKKIKEIELLMQDNESLQMKLQSQEDEFRLQNSTLMTELSAVLLNSEQTENELKALKLNNKQPEKPAVDDDLQNELRRLQAENSVLKKKMAESQQCHEKELSNLRNSLRELLSNDETVHSCVGDGSGANVNAIQQSEKDDYEVVEVGDHEVSYKKAGSTIPIREMLKDLETRNANLEKDAMQYEGLKLQLETEQEEKRLLFEQLELAQRKLSECDTKFETEVGKLTDKLKKKQDSVVQLQSEKETLYNTSKRASEELQRTKDQEINQLKELTQRLQTQLNNSLQHFQDHKEHCTRTIQELEGRMTNLRGEVDSQSADRLQELEADRIVLQSQLLDMKTALDSAHRENTNIKEQLRTLTQDSHLLTAQVRSLEEERVGLNDTAESYKKMAEKRKSLLDEMAIHLQTKTDEHQVEVAHLIDKYGQQIDTLSRQIEDEKTRSLDLEKWKSKVDDLENEVRSLEDMHGMSEQQLADTNSKFQLTKAHLENTLKQVTLDHQESICLMKNEHNLALEDIQTQLEISNAQKTEFEETIDKLKQEVKDIVEDKKIHDKKGVSIMKDLKRQLQSEKKRAENLQEKLQEFLSESNPGRSELFRNVDAEKAETSSISSWSMMSGGGHSENKEGKDDSNVSLQNGSSHESPVQSNILEQDNDLLLQRITDLQREKWVLEEKLSHLEQNSGDMAEDLMRKTAIIQHYCMEGKSDPHLQSSTDKLTVKRVVDFIKDKGDEKAKDINRKIQRMLEETLTKNMHLQKDLEVMAEEIVRLSKFSGQLPADGVDTKSPAHLNSLT